MTNAQFQLQALGEPQLAYILHTSSHLVDWASSQTNMMIEGPFDFVDTNAPGFGHRFYRLLATPQ